MKRALVAVVATLIVAACAAPPVDVRPAFADRDPMARAPAAAAGALCPIEVIEVTDARRAPEVLGLIYGRVVKSPPDSGVWLRSILGGLAPRGFKVGFGEDPARTADRPILARVTLRSAWVTAVSTNKVANVVLHLRAERPGRAPVDQDLRGAFTAVDWVNSTGEVRDLVDRAFTRSLDAMAVSLRPLCAP